MATQNKNKQFSFSILTKEGPIVNNEKAVSIQVPTVDGYITILCDHTPYISDIDYGIVYIRDGNIKRAIYVEGGIVEAAKNNVNLLVSFAVEARDIDSNKIKESIEKIEKIKSINMEEAARNKKAIAKLKTQLSLIEK